MPPTPARMIADAIGANSRIDANTKNPPKPVDRPEQDQEVPRLQPRRPVAERDRRDHQRQPTEPQHEQELLHELRPIRERRPHSRHQRLARQNHHVPNLLQQGLRRQKDAISSATDQLAPPPGERPPRRSRRCKPMAWAPRPPEATPAPMPAPERRSPPRIERRAAPGRSGGWYVRPAVRARSTHAGSAIAAIALAALASCGGGDPQDANEPEGDFEVEVVSATFPEKQKLGKSSDFEITVRNAGDEAVPNLAVTVNGFGFRSEQAGSLRPEPAAIRDRRRAPGGRRLSRGTRGGPRRLRDGLREHLGVRAARAGRRAARSAGRSPRWPPAPTRSATAWPAASTARRRPSSKEARRPRERFAGTISQKANHTRIGADGKTVVVD